MKSSRQSRCIFVVSNTNYVASCLLCSCSRNLGFYDRGRLGRGERATSGVVAGENLPFCANKYGTFNMVITQKKKSLAQPMKMLAMQAV